MVELKNHAHLKTDLERLPMKDKSSILHLSYLERALPNLANLELQNRSQKKAAIAQPSQQFKTKKSVGRDSDSYAPDSSEEETAVRSKSNMELSESLDEAEEVKQAVEDAPTSDFKTLLAAGVPWKNSSCWIDSSLQVLYAAVVGLDYISF